MNPVEFLDEFLDEFFNPKTRVLGLSVGEDFVILACVVFKQCHCQRVTDRQTDRRTDIPIVASTACTGLAATLTPCKNIVLHAQPDGRPLDAVTAVRVLPP